MSRPNKPKLDLREMGLRIRDLRGDVRQEELALHLGVSQSQLSKIERGKVAPTLDVLMGLATRFGKSLDWIATGHGT
jgi:transcriptional regulator with XRE-family HTH domain